MQLPQRAIFTLAQLPTADLRLLCSAHGLRSDAERPALLAALQLRLAAGQPWVAAPVEARSPERAKGLLMAYGGTLYMYGGLPRFLMRPPVGAAQRLAYPDNEGTFIMLSRETGDWEKVVCTGVVPQSPNRIQAGAAGVVHEGKLWLVGNFRVPAAEPTAGEGEGEREGGPNDDAGAGPQPAPVVEHNSVFCYCFRTRHWRAVEQRNEAPLRWYHRIAVHGNRLLLFGGEDRPLAPLAPEQALWSFDLSAREWAQLRPTGDLPLPKNTNAFDVWGGAAYTLSCNLDTKLLEVHRLDLERLVWENLGSCGCAPSCRKAISATIMQDQWVIFGGVWDGETLGDVFTYDFCCNRWSLVRPAGTATARYNHGAVAVDDMLFVVGGLRYHRRSQPLEPVDAIERLWQQPQHHVFERQPPEIVNCGLTGTLGRMFEEQLLCDVRIDVEGRSFGAHRAVLAAASPVFRSMFSGGFSEGTGRLVISGLAPEAVNLLLRYLYGCLPRQLAVDQAFLLFQASDKYGCEECNAHCVRVLRANISVDTVFDLAQLAYMHQCDELLEACVTFAATVNDLAGILGSETSQRLLDDSRMQILHWFSSRTAERSPRKPTTASYGSSPPRFAMPNEQ